MNPLQLEELVAVPASFRDPSGSVYKRDGSIYRGIEQSYRANYDRLMSSGLYQSLVDQHLLIPHEEVQAPAGLYKMLKPEIVSFISYPYEWCFSQLKAAALTTLAIQRKALEQGMTLKDASAFNIQFLGGRPVLIDTLSFSTYSEGEPWVAYKQFCQHFLAPLALMAYKDLRLSRMLQSHIDGIPLNLACTLLPVRARFNRGVLMHLFAHAQQQHKFSVQPAQKLPTLKMPQAVLLALIGDLEKTIASLRLKIDGPSEWSDYYQNTNYSEDSLSQKENIVERFLKRLAPKTAWDLGANVGNFSRIASRLGIQTISMDMDALCVERNYLQCSRDPETNVLPIVLDLTTPTPKIGWANEERMSLEERGPADVLLALALIHHLAIANNVPLDRIARYLAQLGRHLIIEFVPKNDSQVQRLLASRQDIFPNYTQEEFELCFGKYFRIEAREHLTGSHRVLYVMTAHTQESAEKCSERSILL